MDLCSSSTRIVTPEEGTVILDTGIHGPPPPGMFFLIIGRASSSLRGLSVTPTLVDNDYQGEIKILASARDGPLMISQGQRIAQALPLPLYGNFSSVAQTRGKSQPGSSDIYWVQKLTKTRPTLQLWLDEKPFLGLLDTGADATVLSKAHWPRSWPLQATTTHLKGIGQSQNTLQSSKALQWRDKEGNSGIVTPFVVDGLPINLWGRDILTQMGVIMMSPNEAVTKMMLKTGYLPGRGLGKEEQGMKQPITPKCKTDRRGLGENQEPTAPTHSFS